jgi:hypothetical protein
MLLTGISINVGCVCAIAAFALFVTNEILLREISPEICNVRAAIDA